MMDGQRKQNQVIIFPNQESEICHRLKSWTIDKVRADESHGQDKRSNRIISKCLYPNGMFSVSYDILYFLSNNANQRLVLWNRKEMRIIWVQFSGSNGDECPAVVFCKRPALQKFSSSRMIQTEHAHLFQHGPFFFDSLSSKQHESTMRNTRQDLEGSVEDETAGASDERCRIPKLQSGRSPCLILQGSIHPAGDHSTCHQRPHKWNESRFHVPFVIKKVQQQTCQLRIKVTDLAPYLCF